MICRGKNRLLQSHTGAILFVARGAMTYDSAPAATVNYFRCSELVE